MRSVTAWCAAVCCGTTAITTASGILAGFGKEKMMEDARVGASFLLGGSWLLIGHLCWL
jgi:hypothetical protein